MPIPSALLARPENRILQLCAGGTARSNQFVAVLGEVQDWHSLVERLLFHRLTLFFLHHVRGHEALVPEDVLAELQKNGDQILYWNLFLLTELQQVVETLTTQGVRVLAYKGPSLAYSAYGTMALRRFVDLDLLVSPQEKAEAVRILQGAGFITARTALTPYFRLQKKKVEYETSLQSQDGQTFIDLHWFLTAPFESFPLGFEKMWERRVAMGSIAGVHTLRNEDLIVALCFHGTKHLWEEMEWVGCLLHLLQRSEELDWNFIESLVLRKGCERILYLGLRLALDLSEATEGQFQERGSIIPLEVQQRIDRDRAVEQMAQRIWERILPEEESTTHRHFKLLQYHFAHIYVGVWARRGWSRKKEFLVGATRTGLLSLERSRLALKIMMPLLKLCWALFGRPAKTHSL